MELKDKKVVVVGLGKSGNAAARFLATQGAKVFANDQRTACQMGGVAEELTDEGITVVGGGHHAELLLDCDLIVLSPGVPLAMPVLQEARAKGIEIIGEVELASRFLTNRIIGITGSNGKSTVTALTEHLLQTGGAMQATACGNIGTPIIELLADTSSEARLVAELSSFQLETIDTFHPATAVVLNVTPDHMNRYPSFDAYKQAKLNIFRNQTADDFALVNVDEKHRDEIVAATKARIISFGVGEFDGDGVYAKEGTLHWRFDGETVPLLPAAEVSIPGPHNLSNAMAAAAFALLEGVSPEQVAEGLRTFHALEHRMEPVGTFGGVTYINDSKATNIDSTAVALQSFEQPLVVLLGGKDKEGDFRQLNDLLAANARHVVLVGDAAKKIDSMLAANIKRSFSENFEDAVRIAFATAEAGDVVLLSPGCASFDQFRSFEHRGEEFKRLVKEMAHG